uniref:THAP domain-containing protein 9 n=2 Tax=Schizaphis graminum TaxID=13262 RepID=A0A2S2NNN9_SCHGA
MYNNKDVNMPIEIILDAAHMLKLIRNAFGEKKKFLDFENKIVDFDYIEKLFILQEKEGCHLGNKLRKQHIFFFKQKMKVKLAAQLLSQSVADAIKFCKNNLKLKTFLNSDATIRFIEIFNTAFDICNSRSANAIGNKKALSKDNFNYVKDFTNKFINYVKELKVNDNVNNNMFIPVLQSKRKTGFIGFIVTLNSILNLYNRYIDNLQFIRTYRLSQDHLELFFGTIRSHGGHNNNPTAKQFRAAYRKIVIRTNDVQSFNTGNCIPLEHIDILHYSSSDPVKVINCSTEYDNNIDVVDVDSFIHDHSYIVGQNTYEFSEFSKEVIIYISGFVVHKLSSIIKCEICVSSLFSYNKQDFLNSLITLKNRGGNKGGLTYPSDDVILICLQTEKILKSYNYQNKAINKLFIQTKVLSHFMNNNSIFSSLKNHSTDSTSSLSDHLTHLIKSISLTYLSLKIKYSIKSHNETPSLRMWYNKLTLFKGQ